MTFELPELPFGKDALLPDMSPETFEYHHGKHHRAYVENANRLLVGTGLENKTLEEVVLACAGKPDMQMQALFNNAAQHFNHSMFWRSLVPSRQVVAMPEVLQNAILRDFGSMEDFRRQFVATGMAQFGSGWIWLVVDAAGKLEIVKTPNAHTPIVDGKRPLLVCDVWEHAYYIDYRNARQKFLEAFMDRMANWEFAADNLAMAG
ncbi:MAG TPA: superoxide dismutase [Rhodospirillaceae bacterium]|nr:MAG: superoxide dismutase [Alphaproteobacteria bacterium GWF2_58_20]HAU28835.1 superoxide dismutase [Rhodospirillaceae bacterium]